MTRWGANRQDIAGCEMTISDEDLESMHKTLDADFRKFAYEWTSIFFDEKIGEIVYFFTVDKIDGYEFWDLLKKHDMRIHAISSCDFGPCLELTVKISRPDWKVT
jgi:hypothetical protein